jgi:hypothetical protein
MEEIRPSLILKWHIEMNTMRQQNRNIDPQIPLPFLNYQDAPSRERMPRKLSSRLAGISCSKRYFSKPRVIS